MDLVGEGVGVAGGDRGDVVLVGVDAGHELHDGRGKGLLHCVTDLCALFFDRVPRPRGHGGSASSF